MRVAAVVVAAVLAIAAAAAVPVMRAVRDPVGPEPPGGFAALRREAGYEQSASCLPCHPDHHATWARTYHRTMTQDASERSIVAPFDGTPVTFHGITTIPRREDGRFVMETENPAGGGRATLTIVRTTGSRRMQQYHARFGDSLVRLPVAWSIAEQRWFHLDEAFFHGPDHGFHDSTATWNTNCLFCHATGGRPGMTPDGELATSVEELGIACEACHGPGEEHARRMRSPLRREAFRLAGFPVDPTIVNPGRLEQERSVQVCGHCHAAHVPADLNRTEEMMREGDGFVPGEDLFETWTPIVATTRVFDLDYSRRFWKDGTPRLTAYELQAVMASPCYRGGDFTCLSCHSMHESEPEGQMRRDVPGDAQCTQCHAEMEGPQAAAAHARHGSGSTGSACIACHMPPDVYGVMSWHPSHLISIPDPAAAERARKPDACTACHAGRSREWARRETARLFPSRAASQGAPGEGSAAVEMARALFEGDAPYRTFAAWRLGEPAPPEHDVARLAAPLLAEALLDSFPNVRRTAARSLERVAGLDGIPEAMEPEDARIAMRDRIQSRPVGAATPGWPLTPDGAIDRARVELWKATREEVSFSFGE